MDEIFLPPMWLFVSGLFCKARAMAVGVNIFHQVKEILAADVLLLGIVQEGLR